MSTRTLLLAALAILIASAVIGLSPARAAPPLEVVDVLGPAGEKTRYLALRPSSGTTSIKTPVLLFAGGDGLVLIADDGAISGPLAENFLVRSRQHFIDAKVPFVAVVGVPTSYPGGLNGDIRLSADYAASMKSVIADIQKRSGLKLVWMIGTSAGSMSAVGVAARLAGTKQEPAGVVLPSPQVRADAVADCNRTVFHLGDMLLGQIQKAAFFVYNKGDTCVCSDPSFIAPLYHKLVSAQKRATYGLLSTTATSPPCQAHAPHGFHGIEHDTVGIMVKWIKSPVTINVPAKFP
jgi:hypothetical protein